VKLGVSPVELRRIQQLLRENETSLMEKWNASFGSEAGRARQKGSLCRDTLAVDLIDGRTIVVPLAWYPRFLDATEAQRQNWLVSSAGYGLHRPDIAEDLSTAGLLRGAPAAEPAWTSSPR
jgi:hypothetical protein